MRHGTLFFHVVKFIEHSKDRQAYITRNVAAYENLVSPLIPINPKTAAITIFIPALSFHFQLQYPRSPYLEDL